MYRVAIVCDGCGDSSSDFLTRKSTISTVDNDVRMAGWRILYKGKKHLCPKCSQIKDCKKGRSPCMPAFDDDRARQALSERRYRILNAKRDGESYQRIGEREGISRERVRQIVKDSLRKIRLYEKKCECAIENETVRDPRSLDCYFYGGGLVRRSYNSLRRAGFETIDEIMDLSIDDLLKIRNCGQKSASMIAHVIEEERARRKLQDGRKEDAIWN